MGLSAHVRGDGSSTPPAQQGRADSSKALCKFTDSRRAELQRPDNRLRRSRPNMSYPTRSLSTHMRGPSVSASTASQSPALVARIEEKRAELEHLKELRDLSAAVATQMEALEQKVSTLSDGTEGMSLGTNACMRGYPDTDGRRQLLRR